MFLAFVVGAFIEIFVLAAMLQNYVDKNNERFKDDADADFLTRNLIENYFEGEIHLTENFNKDN